MSSQMILVIAVAIMVTFFACKLVHFFVKSSYEEKLDALSNRADVLQKSVFKQTDCKAMLTDMSKIMSKHTGCLIESTDELLNIYLNLTDETKMELCEALKEAFGLPLSPKAINELLGSILSSYKKMNNEKQYEFAMAMFAKFIEKC